MGCGGCSAKSAVKVKRWGSISVLHQCPPSVSSRVRTLLQLSAHHDMLTCAIHVTPRDVAHRKVNATLSNVIYFSYIPWFEGKPVEEIQQKLRMDLAPTYIIDCGCTCCAATARAVGGGVPTDFIHLNDSSLLLLCGLLLFSSLLLLLTPALLPAAHLFAVPYANVF